MAASSPVGSAPDPDGEAAPAKVSESPKHATDVASPDGVVPPTPRKKSAERPEDLRAEPETATESPAHIVPAAAAAAERQASLALSTESGETDDSSPTPPPLPNEPLPQQEDDGWEYHWVPNTSSYWFYNRFTEVWQQENPRVPAASSSGAPGTAPVAATTAAALLPPPPPPSGLIASAPGSVANGYNPAIHGDYDPNAWYAQGPRAAEEAVQEAASVTIREQAAALLGAGEYEDSGGGEDGVGTGGFFNRQTGQWQRAEQGAERHGDEARSRRQLNAFFDVDAAANMHDGRSLKAERAGKKPSKAELKAFKEKRRAKKEEKRRAWLRD